MGKVHRTGNEIDQFQQLTKSDKEINGSALSNVLLALGLIYRETTIQLQLCPFDVSFALQMKTRTIKLASNETTVKLTVTPETRHKLASSFTIKKG